MFLSIKFLFSGEENILKIQAAESDTVLRNCWNSPGLGPTSLTSFCFASRLAASDYSYLASQVLEGYFDQ